MEYWALCDENGASLGKIVEKGSPIGPAEFHLAAEAWMINAKGEILIQQRSASCAILPGIWGLTTGRILAGEDSAAGCAREIMEELGVAVRPEELVFLRRIVRRDGTKLIWDLYLIFREIPDTAFSLQAEEVAQVKWVSADEFRVMLKNGDLFQYPEIASVLSDVTGRGGYLRPETGKRGPETGSTSSLQSGTIDAWSEQTMEVKKRV